MSREDRRDYFPIHSYNFDLDISLKSAYFTLERRESRERYIVYYFVYLIEPFPDKKPRGVNKPSSFILS